MGGGLAPHTAVKFPDLFHRDAEYREMLTLPSPIGELWQRTRALIYEALAPVGVCRLGGGTVLARRYRHRLSSDIDVTVEPPDAEHLPDLRRLLVEPGSRTRRRLEALGARFSKRYRYRAQVRLSFTDGDIDIFAVPLSPPKGHRIAVVQGDPAVVLSSVQILRGKLLRAHNGFVRDQFDVAVAAAGDIASLAAAVNMVYHVDLATIRTDWWKRAETTAAEASTRLKGVPEHLRIEPARLTCRATDALEGARYRHVVIATAGGTGFFEAVLQNGKRIRIDFDRRTMVRTIVANGIDRYLYQYNSNHRRILDRIRAACRWWKRPRRHYERDHPPGPPMPLRAS